MIDDHSRLVYAEVLPTLKASCAIDFLRWAVSWFAPRGVQVRAVMSDDGSAYVAHAYRSALTELGLRHLRIRPYRPRTNGKAERFIQTLANEWAYERIYGSSAKTNCGTASVPGALQLQTSTRLPRPPTARITTDERPQGLQLGASEHQGPPPATRGGGRTVLTAFPKRRHTIGGGETK
jgi:transposase InsO family protein